MGMLQRLMRSFISLVLLWGAVAASALAALDADSMQQYGGTYLSNCKNPASPRVIVQSAALVVQQGNQQMRGGNLQAAHSYFGQSPPPNYVVALLSEVRGGVELQAIVYQDKGGKYLTVDGDAKVRASLGPTLLSQKYRLCGSSGAVASPPEPPPAKQYALTEMSAQGLLYDAKIKALYLRTLGAKRGTPWLAELDGPSPTNRKVRVGGAEYILAGACKNHDCYDHNVVLLYAQDQGKIYGRIYERGRVTFIGQPSARLRPELDHLWKSEWRRNP